MSNVPARLSDTARNPFFVLTAGFVTLVIAVVTISRRIHK